MLHKPLRVITSNLKVLMLPEHEVQHQVFYYYYYTQIQKLCQQKNKT